MKLTIGWPSIRPNAPSWKTATVAPSVASTREQEAEGRGQRHQDRAEDEHQQHEREPDDDGEIDRQSVAEPLGDVGRDRGQSGDPDLRRGLLLDRRPGPRAGPRAGPRSRVSSGRRTRGDQDLGSACRPRSCPTIWALVTPSCSVGPGHDFVVRRIAVSAVSMARPSTTRAAARRGPGRRSRRSGPTPCAGWSRRRRCRRWGRPGAGPGAGWPVRRGRPPPGPRPRPALGRRAGPSGPRCSGACPGRRAWAGCGARDRRRPWTSSARGRPEAVSAPRARR